MTTEPNAFAVRLAGGIPKLRLDGDIGDPVALLVIGHIAADGFRATATGITRTVGVKLEEAVPVTGEHADEIRKAVNRATRAREDAAKGLEVVPELAPGSVDGDALTVSDAVDRFLNSDELDEDPLLDPDASLVGDRDAIIAKADELVAAAPAPAPFSPLELAWDHVDRVEPGYADASVSVRRSLVLREGVTSAPWVLRPFLLIEELELDDNGPASAELRSALASAIAAGEERYVTEEPWHGYAKATVRAIAEHLDRNSTQAATHVARGNYPGVLEHVIRYERAHKKRSSIIDAALATAGALGYVIPGEEAPDA